MNKTDKGDKKEHTCPSSLGIWGHAIAKHRDVQCESKKSPLRFSNIFPQTVGNF